MVTEQETQVTKIINHNVVYPVNVCNLVPCKLPKMSRKSMVKSLLVTSIDCEKHHLKVFVKLLGYLRLPEMPMPHCHMCHAISYCHNQRHPHPEIINYLIKQIEWSRSTSLATFLFSDFLSKQVVDPKCRRLFACLIKEEHTYINKSFFK